MKKDYAIDFVNNAVIVTKAFYKKASTGNGEEFKALMNFRDLGMEIKVKESTPRKRKSQKSAQLKYSQMINYISCVENAEMYLKQFNAMREAARSQKNPYLYVLQWFNKTFPDFNKLPKFNENMEIVVAPEAHTPIYIEKAS